MWDCRSRPRAVKCLYVHFAIFDMIPVVLGRSETIITSNDNRTGFAGEIVKAVGVTAGLAGCTGVESSDYCSSSPGICVGMFWGQITDQVAEIEAEDRPKPQEVDEVL